MGCNPSLRGFKGLGFGRTLPAPFSFDNAIERAATNNNSDNVGFIPNLPNPIPNQWSLQFWVKQRTVKADDNLKAVFQIRTTGNSSFVKVRGFGGWLINGGIGSKSGGITLDVWNLVTLTFDMSAGTYAFYINDGTPITGTFTAEPNTTATVYFFWSRLADGSDTGISTGVIDEVRVYNKIQTQALHLLAYNSGIGENPPETEFLRCWYKCQAIENLDFSTLQDGSDMRNGLRDYSGNNKHSSNISGSMVFTNT